MSESGSGQAANQGTESAGRAKRAMLPLLGGAGCLAAFLLCCLMAALGNWLEVRERRSAYGPPALARAFADRAVAKAEEDERNIREMGDRQNPIERQHDEASAAAYRDLASALQARADTLQDGEVVDVLHGELARVDKGVCERLQAVLASLKPDETEARTWLTARIEGRPSPREEVARWVEAKQRELGASYLQARRGRSLDPGPGGSSAAGPGIDAGVSVSASTLVREYDANEVGADSKYKGKVLRVSGSVGEVKKDIVDDAYAILRTGHPLRSVQVYFAGGQTERLSKLRPGQSITVQGRCDGLMMNVIIKDASFTE